MNKEEFLKLFELEDIYIKNQSKKNYVLGLFDRLSGTTNEIFYVFDNNKIKINVFCVDFNIAMQELEINLILNDDYVELNMNNTIKNEIFPFLTFDTNLDASLKFVANFLNKILIPKYQLMGSVS